MLQFTAQEPWWLLLSTPQPIDLSVPATCLSLRRLMKLLPALMSDSRESGTSRTKRAYFDFLKQWWATYSPRAAHDPSGWSAGGLPDSLFVFAWPPAAPGGCGSLFPAGGSCGKPCGLQRLAGCCFPRLPLAGGGGPWPLGAAGGWAGMDGLSCGPPADYPDGPQVAHHCFKG